MYTFKLSRKVFNDSVNIMKCLDITLVFEKVMRQTKVTVDILVPVLIIKNI